MAFTQKKDWYEREECKLPFGPEFSVLRFSVQNCKRNKSRNIIFGVVLHVKAFGVEN
jgi:hypothetical protein